MDFKPAFENNNVAVAMAVNDKFVPYLAVLLNSIIANSSINYNYDVFVLSDDITFESCEKLQALIGDRNNYFIRFIDPSPLIKNYHFHVRSFWSIQTYYRLVLPEILTNYEKVLYLDSDMVVCDDISKIYQEDISDYLVGACIDVDTAGLYNGYDSTKKKYMDKVINLDDPYKYFQAGTILFNLQRIREKINTTELLELATSRKWQLLDQDVLNVVCKNEVKYLDLRWNVMVDMECIRVSEIFSYSPSWMVEEYKNARRNVGIIHYAGPEKPWNNPKMDMADSFYHYLKDTPFQKVVIANSVNDKLISNREKTKQVVKKIYNSICYRGVIDTIKVFGDKIKHAKRRKGKDVSKRRDYSI